MSEEQFRKLLDMVNLEEKPSEEAVALLMAPRPVLNWAVNVGFRYVSGMFRGVLNPFVGKSGLDWDSYGMCLDHLMPTSGGDS